MVRVNCGSVLLLLAVTEVHPALADFRVTPTALPGTVSDIPHVDPGDTPHVLTKSAAKQRPHSIITVIGRSDAASGRAAVGVADGFGAGVPLAFACRQIVPKTITVVYGRNVDPATPVNWMGGRPWAAVLRDAIQPAGLTLVPHGTTVEIRK